MLWIQHASPMEFYCHLPQTNYSTQPNPHINSCLHLPRKSYTLWNE